MCYSVVMLNNLNFSLYYNNDYNNDNSMEIVDILNVFYEYTDSSLVLYAFKEYLYFYKDDII